MMREVIVAIDPGGKFKNPWLQWESSHTLSARLAGLCMRRASVATMTQVTVTARPSAKRAALSWKSGTDTSPSICLYGAHIPADPRPESVGGLSALVCRKSLTIEGQPLQCNERQSVVNGVCLEG